MAVAVMLAGGALGTRHHKHKPYTVGKLTIPSVRLLLDLNTKITTAVLSHTQGGSK